jgi:hypothetical protein
MECVAPPRIDTANGRWLCIILRVLGEGKLVGGCVVECGVTSGVTVTARTLHASPTVCNLRSLQRFSRFPTPHLPRPPPQYNLPSTHIGGSVVQIQKP